MSRPIIVVPQAEAQIQTIDAWWRNNRNASPDLFVQELTEALSTIMAGPEAGVPYPHPGVKGMRRILLLPIHGTS